VNPILPLRHFIPDVEARVWSDGRIHLYGSCDLPGSNAYCSYEYRVFSSADLTTWTDHGVSLCTIGDGAVPWTQSLLFAPDCVFHNGRYHLFFCTESQREGVASSPSPTGPFADAAPVEGADKDGIDPAVLVDDDGQAYLYWGQFHLRGAKLRADLKGIEPATLQTSLLNDKEHGFHEGASIRKRGGIYYLVFTDAAGGKGTRLSYATSHSPLGPFVKQGVIVDNIGCDPGVTNNHGSICEFGGQWYVFYHRSSQGLWNHRRVCIEPIAFDAQGRIAEVEMTTQGHTGPIPAENWLEAGRACLLKGSVRSGSSGHPADDCPEHLGQTRHGDWAAYKYLDFGTGMTWCEAEMASMIHGGIVEIRLDHPSGALIGTVTVGRTESWQSWQRVRGPVTPVAGIHAVYLVFRGPVDNFRSVLFNLRRFRFGRNP
jgi:hypothetical protein